MELANLIHPALGLLAALSILTAYGVRLFGIQNNALHYTAGITAAVALILAVIRAMMVAAKLVDLGIEAPPVMGFHAFNAVLLILLLLTQATLGILIWRRKPDIPIRAFMVHSIVGPVLALLAIVQIVLGILTFIGLMR